MRNNKDAPLWHAFLALLSTCAKGVQLYCPSRTYLAIPYCTIFSFLEHRAVVNTDLPKPFIFIVDHSSQYFSLGLHASNLNENLLKFSLLSLLEGSKSGMTIDYLVQPTYKFILTHCKINLYWQDSFLHKLENQRDNLSF